MQPDPVLLDALFWCAVLGCAIAQFFILRTAFRPVAPVDADGRSSLSAGPLSAPMLTPSSRRPMEILWAVLPVLLLAAAFYLAWRAMHPMMPTLALSS